MLSFRAALIAILLLAKALVVGAYLAANEADTKLPALTEVSVPAMDDVLYLVDVSDTTEDATGTSRKVTLSRMLGMGWNGICQGRLTTESGVPVSITDRAAQSTIYFTPYTGNKVSLYDGTRWKLLAFSEASLALTGLTTGKNYDVFVYDNAGAAGLELSAAWTNDTTRADALGLQDGIYVKSAVNTRRYVGTLRASSATTTEDTGTPAAGTTAKRFVWNMHNRVPRFMRAIEDADQWTYGTNTFRSANGDATNRLEFVVGMDEVLVDATLTTQLAVTNGELGTVAIGLDSTTAFVGECAQGYNADTTALAVSAISARYSGYPGKGYHFLQWLETAQGTIDFYGDNGGSMQSGIRGALMG